MKVNQVAEFRCCLTCVYRKPYPPSTRGGNVVFSRFFCGLAMDSNKDIVKPEEKCSHWKGASLDME